MIGQAVAAAAVAALVVVQLLFWPCLVAVACAAAEVTETLLAVVPVAVPKLDAGTYGPWQGGLAGC